MYIRILENDDWIVEYDAENNQYRVGYFQGNHFVDEVVFNTNEWIPVSERLPEKFESVLLSTQFGGVIAVCSTSNKRWVEESGRNPYVEDKVLAWMPFPEPYVPDTNVENIKE